jgi:transposase
VDLSTLHLNWGESSYQGVKYRSYSLARSFRENGKNRKEIVIKLGKLSEDELKQWKAALKAARSPKNSPLQMDDIIVTSSRNYLDVAVLKEIWDFWDLDAVFDETVRRKNRNHLLSVVASALAINRCVDPSSKSRVPFWYERTALPVIQCIPPSAMNSSRIFRELSCIEECRIRLCKHLYQKMIATFPEAMQRLFYDLSSTTFSGTRCILVEWGHCKEGYENHVVLALVVNSIGLPIYWEVLPGGTADATTISWLLSRLKEHFPAVELPTVVFDRGMVSEDNLLLLESAGVKYISAMDKNQIEALTGIDFSQFLHFTDEKEAMKNLPDFVKLNETAFCKEVKVVGTRRYVLCFNPQLFKDQQKARQEALSTFEEYLKASNEELMKAQKGRTSKATQNRFNEQLKKSKIQEFTSVLLEEAWARKETKKGAKAIATYQGKLEIDVAKMRQAGRLDGFWLLVTNHSERSDTEFEKSTANVVEPYREKVVIESSFRDIKSFVEIAPVHVWTAQHVNAHYTICVLAHLLNRTLSLRLNERPGEKTTDIVSHGKLYEELADCYLNSISGSGTPNVYSLTQPTIRQVELLERLKMTHLISNATMNELRSKVVAG